MKFFVVVFSAVVGLQTAVFAQNSTPKISYFSGQYGSLIVNFNPNTGKLKVADRWSRKVYAVNVRSGQEVPLDVDFLHFSKDFYVRNAADYIVGATISADMPAPGLITFNIKVKANFEGGTDPQAILVFKAYSQSFQHQSYNGYGQGEFIVNNAIHSSLHFSHVENPTGSPTSTAATILTSVLEMIGYLWPANGIQSTMYEGYWY